MATRSGDDRSGDWPGADKLFFVQDILEKNKLLINEINKNHADRTEESLERNDLLIRELNGNVTKVVELYRELSLFLLQAANTSQAS
jgi:hypothetical protein